MKKLIVLNLLLTEVICGKITDLSQSVVEDIVHHADQEHIDMAYELASTRFPTTVVIDALLECDE